jgi:hypothetical protein
MNLLLYPIVLVGAFLLSYAANTGTISVFTRRPTTNVIVLSTSTDLISWANFYLIGKISDWNMGLMFADVIGDVVGDLCVSRRYPRWLWVIFNRPRKKKVKEKLPKDLTTA